MRRAAIWSLLAHRPRYCTCHCVSFVPHRITRREWDGTQISHRSEPVPESDTPTRVPCVRVSRPRHANSLCMYDDDRRRRRRCVWSEAG